MIGASFNGFDRLMLVWDTIMIGIISWHVMVRNRS